MFAKRFFYVCAGLLCLTLAYHFGAVSATAQQGSMVSGFTTLTTTVWPAGQNNFYVLTANGDIYGSNGNGATLVGNFWGGPTAAQRESFGSMKARYRGERGAVQPAPQGR